MRLAAGEKKAEEEEKKRQRSEFGSGGGNSLELARNRSVTPSCGLMTRSAYGPGSYPDYGRNDRSQSKTPQMSRRSSSRSGYGRESVSPYSWQSFKPVIKPSAYHPLTSDRAEPDGIENDDDYRPLKLKSNLEGEYDHSKEYDPFEVRRRRRRRRRRRSCYFMDNLMGWLWLSLIINHWQNDLF